MWPPWEGGLHNKVEDDNSLLKKQLGLKLERFLILPGRDPNIFNTV